MSHAHGAGFGGYRVRPRPSHGGTSQDAASAGFLRGPCQGCVPARRRRPGGNDISSTWTAIDPTNDARLRTPARVTGSSSDLCEAGSVWPESYDAAMRFQIRSRPVGLHDCQTEKLMPGSAWISSLCWFSWRSRLGAELSENWCCRAREQEEFGSSEVLLFCILFPNASLIIV